MQLINLFKLMNNSTFGKAMEILGNRAYVRLVINTKDIKN